MQLGREYLDSACAPSHAWSQDANRVTRVHLCAASAGRSIHPHPHLPHPPTPCYSITVPGMGSLSVSASLMASLAAATSARCLHRVFTGGPSSCWPRAARAAGSLWPCLPQPKKPAQSMASVSRFSVLLPCPHLLLQACHPSCGTCSRGKTASTRGKRAMVQLAATARKSDGPFALGGASVVRLRACNQTIPKPQIALSEETGRCAGGRRSFGFG